jgi:hypothetical protein
MAKKKAVVITFGRFQPPTIGHEKLVGAVIAHAQKIGAEHRIYASQSFDGNRPKAEIKNPLQYTDKIKFMRKMFPKANIVKGDDDTNTFMRVLYQLEKEGYTTVHVVVGQDRVPEIKKTVDQYLGSDDSETGLNFEEFKVVSAGKRDPEAEGVEGMSASKLRAAAAENNFKLFKKGMPSGFSDARGLFDAIRKGLERPMKPTKKTKKKVNEELLNEVAPPDEKSERFVKKSKESFKDRYGDDWASYLYGMAWKQYNKRHGKKTKTRLGEPIEDEEESADLQEAKAIPFDPKAYYAWFDRGIVGPYKSEEEAWYDTGGDVDWIKQGKDLTAKEKRQLKESLELHEGAVKASMEDWLEGLPKKVVQELKTKYGKILKRAHHFGTFSVNDPDKEAIRKVLIRNKVKPLLGDKNHAEATSAVLMSFWTFHGDNPASVVDFQNPMMEETLQEGGVKGALEDYLYSIPKEAIEELKPVMKIKNLGRRFGMINKTLKKHGFTQKFMGSFPADVVNSYFDTYFGESLEEATIPRNAKVIDRNKEEKTVTLQWYDNDDDKWYEEEVPEDEVPGFYDRAAEPLKKRKTDRFGNIVNPPKKGAEKKTEKAAAANTKNAEEILDIFDRKPMKTPITIYGKKWGKSEEYEMVVMKRMYQGDEVFVVKSSGRFVELRTTSAGLQVIDVKTKRILLDKGNDATW